jgi:hypothetical protein
LLRSNHGKTKIRTNRRAAADGKIAFRSPKTLRKHFREELSLGEIEAVAQVAQTHYQMAKSGKYPASTIHFLEKRQRWLDVQDAEIRPTMVPDFIVSFEKEAA